VLLIVVLVAAACSPIPAAPPVAVGPTPTAAQLSPVPPAETPTQPPPTASPTPPSLAVRLANLAYAGVLDQPVKLTDGVAQYDDGSTTKPVVRLSPEFTATGDLNGDGLEDAVVVLRNETSGTGRFVYLAAVLDARGNPTPLPAVLVGDRVIVKSLAVRDGKVAADLVVQGPNDGLCCPSLDASWVFALQDGELAQEK
jgi:hypothetical protein